MSLKSNWPKQLLDWYLHQKRDLPWRKNQDPYPVWISEMMLQQTQVSSVIDYFNRFLNRFPTVETLAKAPIDDVLKCWEGLGYYSRARNLKKAAEVIAFELNGVFPNTFESLKKLPGIGPYSAAAIASIAFNEKIPVVDGNVLRVFSRFWDCDLDIGLTKTKDYFFNLLQKSIKSIQNPGDFNQAMMELGALLCSPKSPKCLLCPIEQDCQAKKNGTLLLRPVKTKKAPVPTFDVVVGLLKKNNKILIAKRPEDKLLGGLWEFPGGKVEKNETNQDALKREFLEELQIDIQVLDYIGEIKHAYSHFKINLKAYYCSIKKGSPKQSNKTALKWINKKQFKDFAFPKANKKLFPFLKD